MKLRGFSQEATTLERQLDSGRYMVLSTAGGGDYPKEFDYCIGIYASREAWEEKEDAVLYITNEGDVNEPWLTKLLKAWLPDDCIEQLGYAQSTPAS